MAGIPGLEPGPRRFRHMAQSPSMAFGHSGKDWPLPLAPGPI